MGKRGEYGAYMYRTLHSLSESSGQPSSFGSARESRKYKRLYRSFPLSIALCLPQTPEKGLGNKVPREDLGSCF